MTQQELLNEFLSLPVEAQLQVMEFIAVLRQQYPVVEPAKELVDDNLANDSFMGMWRDRQDLTDSNAWVRSLRKHEWL